jgi:hypothetical protein
MCVLPNALSRRTQSVLAMLLLASGACAPIDVTGSQRYFCFEFTPTNGTDLAVVDIHIPLGGPPVDVTPQAPDYWEGQFVPGGGLVFRTPVTPVPPAPGATTIALPPRPRPIAPGERYGPFRFCLDRAQQSGPMLFSHPAGAARAFSPGTVLDAQGQAIPLAADGSTPLTSTAEAYCFDLTITAPNNSAVETVRLEILNPPKVHETFVDGWGPQDWQVNVTGANLAAFGVANRNPIPAGESRTLRVCTTKNNLRIRWQFDDPQGQPIPGQAGAMNLKH